MLSVINVSESHEEDDAEEQDTNKCFKSVENKFFLIIRCL